jgi:diketogulonate reductase-like aldo/keto reductase
MMPSLALGLYLLEDGEETEKTVRDALNLGYKNFDSASFYNNERSVGRALEDSGVPRDDIWVTSKVWTTEKTHDDVVSSIERSVKELGGHPLDLALVHWPLPGHHVDMYRGL